MPDLAQLPLWVFFGALFAALFGLLWAFRDQRREEDLPIVGEVRSKQGMRFRKRPVVIEAEQWFPGKEIEGLIFEPGERGHDYGSGIPGTMVLIKTLEGHMRVSPGDWIITGVSRERYPCKDEIFRLTYEPA